MNVNRFALETPALTGGVVMEGHARYCLENGHAYNRKDGVEQGWCPRCGENNGLTRPSESTEGEIVMRKPLANYLTDRPYDAIDVMDSMLLTKPEIVETILAVIDVNKGDRTRLMKTLKSNLAVIAARIAYEYKYGTAKSGKVGKRPRKPVTSRAERLALGSRRSRRDCNKARKHRNRATNYHHVLTGR